MVLVTILLLTASSCGQSGVGPFGGGLDGQWEWQFNRNPSGSNITFSLVTTGGTVTGTGTICGAGPACTPGPVSVTGQTAGATFQLTIRGDSSFVATYKGERVGSDELKGTWAEGNSSATVIFYRE